MAKHLSIGKKGEEIAIEFLKKDGFEILETNWRHKKLEVDIIAKDGETLVFIEVKTRSTDFFGLPEEYVDYKKEKHLVNAATEYMISVNHEWAFRFDVVAILLRNENDWKVNHIKDAFFP